MTDAEPAEGQVPAGDFQPVPEKMENTTKNESGKSNDEIVGEVLAGLWGRGRDRTERLTEAGYDPKEISELIAKRFG